MKVVLSFCCAALAILTGCHQTPKNATHPRSFPGVVSQQVIFHSSALDRNMTYAVYLRTPGAGRERFPAVYLLHGCGGSFTDWPSESDVGAYAAKSLVLVSVDGDCSYYMNAALSGRSKYEDYLIHDVLADVESKFPVLPGRENRAVVGVSMGGFAAVRLTFTHPELFVFAGAISPAIDVPSRHFSWSRWPQSMRFRSIFGPTGSDTRADTDPFKLVITGDPADTPYLYITAGEKESLLSPIRRFVAVLKQRGYAYEFHTQPGGHDWGEWASEVPGCFESLLAHMRRP